MAIKPYLFSFWMVGITAKRTAIHRTRRRQEGEVLALLIAGRGDVARSAFPQDRRPTKQTERSGQPNPVQLVRPRFEHEHDAAVATLWRTLARCEETPRGRPRRRPCEVGTSTRTIWLRLRCSVIFCAKIFRPSDGRDPRRRAQRSRRPDAHSLALPGGW